MLLLELYAATVPACVIGGTSTTTRVRTRVPVHACIVVRGTPERDVKRLPRRGLHWHYVVELRLSSGLCEYNLVFLRFFRPFLEFVREDFEEARLFPIA